MGGCVSTNILNSTDDEFTQLNSSTLTDHFIKLTSTTYGLLNLDSTLSPPAPSASATAAVISTPMTPPERFIINDKEPMKSEVKRSGGINKENSDPNCRNWNQLKNDDDEEEVLKPLDPKLTEESEKLCEGGENRVVIYTTSLRGVRRTFDACNAVKAAIESFGVVICERDVSMDRGFREELSSLMAGEVMLPPRVFVKGKYIGGAEEVMDLVEQGLLGELLQGVPKKKIRGGACDGCGGLAFLPCSHCNGSCKVVQGWGSDVVVVKCMECNENGLVRCPICS